jgi:hypothetical protein
MTKINIQHEKLKKVLRMELAALHDMMTGARLHAYLQIMRTFFTALFFTIFHKLVICPSFHAMDENIAMETDVYVYFLLRLLSN